MDPLSLFDRILSIAQAIRERSNKVKANKEQAKRLSFRIDSMLNQLRSLSTLPRKDQFVSKMQELEECLT